MTSKIKQDIDEMIENNEITEEDREYAELLFTWLEKGRKAAEKINKKHCEQLEKSGFAKGDKLLVDTENTTIWFCLAIGGMQGLINQCCED